MSAKPQLIDIDTVADETVTMAMTAITNVTNK